MAKIKRGNGLQDIRGSSKGHVYSDWRGRGYLRSKTISGSNPGSSRQADARSSMARFSQVWKTQLTDAQRDLWNQYAKEQAGQKPKMRGAVLIIPYKGFTASGYNTFVQINRLLFSAGLLAPGAFVSVPPTGTELFNSPTGLTGIWNYGWATYLSEDFEDEVNLSPPNQWTPPWTYVFGGGATLLRSTNLLSHAGSLCAQILVAGVPTSFAYIVVPQLNQDGIQVDFYARAAQSNVSIPFCYTQDVLITGVAGLLTFLSTAKWQYNDGGIWKSWGSYVANTWYHVRIVLFNSTKKWEFYIDDMVTPAVTNIGFRHPIVPGALVFHTGPGFGSAYFDDLLIRRPVTEGVVLTWTDPTGMHANSRIRVWTYSEEAGVHKQQVAAVGLGVEAYTITHVRAAKGSLIPVSSLPGHYWCQLDVVDPAGARSGPSNAILVNVPSV